MYRLTIIHRVSDYEAFVDLLRRRSGGRPGLVRRAAYRSTDDCNEVMVELDFDSAEAALQFLPSIDLRGILDELGVEIYPPVFIGELIDELSIDYAHE
jgi:hypothetical protein